MMIGNRRSSSDACQCPLASRVAGIPCSAPKRVQWLPQLHLGSWWAKLGAQHSISCAFSMADLATPASPQLGGAWVVQKIEAQIQRVALDFLHFLTYMAKSLHAGQRADGPGHHAHRLRPRHRQGISLLQLRRRQPVAALMARSWCLAETTAHARFTSSKPSG